MKKLVLAAMAAAFVFGISAAAFADDAAPKVDCTKKENADNPACKKK